VDELQPPLNEVQDIPADLNCAGRKSVIFSSRGGSSSGPEL
jgi:hypothetical protein